MLVLLVSDLTARSAANQSDVSTDSISHFGCYCAAIIQARASGPHRVCGPLARARGKNNERSLFVRILYSQL